MVGDLVNAERDDVRSPPIRPQCPVCAALTLSENQGPGDECPRENRLESGACGAISRGDPGQPSCGNERELLGDPRGRERFDSIETSNEYRAAIKKDSQLLYSVEGCGPMRKHRTLEDRSGHKSSDCSTLEWKRPTQAKRRKWEVREEQPLLMASYM